MAGAWPPITVSVSGGPIKAGPAVLARPAIVTVELFLVTKNFFALALAVILHVVGYLGCLREPRFFDLWMTKVSRCPPVKNSRFWRCNSYSA